MTPSPACGRCSRWLRWIPARPLEAADRWATQRADAIGVWTGTSVLVVGGYNCCSQGHLASGVVWTPRNGQS